MNKDMNLREFYCAVLPPNGPYLLFHSKSKQHTSAATIDELVAKTRPSSDATDTYFAVASFIEAGSRKGDNVALLKAHRVDIDAGAEKLKNHGPDEVYATQRDAMDAVVSAIKAGLPKPSIVVSSGEGLHVYWVLDEAVEPQAWKRTALKINTVAKGFGLKVDAGVTADIARVLRPIGTLHKGGNRVEVLSVSNKTWTNAELDAALAAHLPEEDAFATAPAPKSAKAPNLNDDILKAFEGPPASLAIVADHCAAVAKMRDLGGNIPEPHWRAVMGVAKYCTIDGEQLVHEWSSEYDGYSHRETQDKFDRWETPPTTCAHFDTVAKACAGCKYKGKVTTPKQLGGKPADPAPAVVHEVSTTPVVPQKAEPVSDKPDTAPAFVLPDTEFAVAADPTPDMPVPGRPDLFDQTADFFYKASGSYWTLYHREKKKIPDAKGDKVEITTVKPVIHKLIWLDHTTDVGASDSGGVLKMWAKVSKPGAVIHTPFAMPGSVAGEVAPLVKYFLDQGINLDSENTDAGKSLRQFVLNEFKRTQNDMRFVIKDRFGYHTHEGKLITCLGAYAVHPDGTIVKTVASKSLEAVQKGLVPSVLPDRAQPVWGGADDWKAVIAGVKLYKDLIKTHYHHAGYDDARLAIAIALASPFMAFTAETPFDGHELPASGFLLSLYSAKSGAGKTSMEDVICAAYGRPQALRRAGSSRDITQVAMGSLARSLGVYPFVLDEITRTSNEVVADLVNTMANANSKVRAQTDGTVRGGSAPFSLVACVSTNRSVREQVAMVQKDSDALLLRFMELDFSNLPLTGDKMAFRHDYQKVLQNSGAVGLLQARLVADRGVERMTKMAQRNVAKAEEILGQSQQYRFFTRMLGAVLTNIELLSMFSPFDADDIIKSFKRNVHVTSEFVEGTRRTAPDLLEDLLAFVAPNTAVTKTLSKRNSTGGGDLLLNPNMRTPMLARYIQEERTIWITTAAVVKWAEGAQIGVKEFYKQLKDADLLDTRWTKDNTTATRCIGAGLPNALPHGSRIIAVRAPSAEATGKGIVVPFDTGIDSVDPVKSKPAA